VYLAVVLDLFSSLAFELEFDARWYDVHEVERDIAEYIDGFYNSQRRHSHNRCLSPVDFERQFCQEGMQRSPGVHETRSSPR
jgi:hypothetical protein